MAAAEKIIAIAELVVYVPLLLLTIAIIFRHRLVRALDWISLPVVCVARIFNAALDLETGQFPHEHKREAVQTAIFDALVLCLLLVTSLRLLMRVNDSTSPTFLRGYGIACLQLPCFVALILYTVGDSRLSSSKPPTVNAGKTLTRAAWAMLLFTYIILAQLIVVVTRECRRRYRDEAGVVVALVAALPFLAVRLVYSLLVDVTAIDVFSLTGGNAIARLCMATLMEFGVIASYTAAGITTPQSRDPKSAKLFIRLRNTGSEGEILSGKYINL